MKKEILPLMVALAFTGGCENNAISSKSGPVNAETAPTAETALVFYSLTNVNAHTLFEEKCGTYNYYGKPEKVKAWLSKYPKIVECHLSNAPVVYEELVAIEARLIEYYPAVVEWLEPYRSMTYYDTQQASAAIPEFSSRSSDRNIIAGLQAKLPWKAATSAKIRDEVISHTIKLEEFREIAGKSLARNAETKRQERESWSRAFDVALDRANKSGAFSLETVPRAKITGSLTSLSPGLDPQARIAIDGMERLLYGNEAVDQARLEAAAARAKAAIHLSAFFDDQNNDIETEDSAILSNVPKEQVANEPRVFKNCFGETFSSREEMRADYKRKIAKVTEENPNARLGCPE